MERLTFICGVGFNFLSHGSQDLYPTYLQTTKGFDSYHSTVATIIGNCGAIAYACHSSDLAPFAYHYVCLAFFVSTVAEQLRAPCHSTSVAVLRSSYLLCSLGHSSRSGSCPTHLVDFLLARSGYSLACRVPGVSSRSNLLR